MGAKPQRRAPALVNRRRLGLCLRSCRYRAGFRNAAQFCRRLNAVGIRISPTTLYRYEQGERRVPIDLLVAVLVLCRPSEGLGACSEAFSALAWEALTARPSRSRRPLL